MITVNQINKIEDARRKVKKEIYKKIFEQFSRKIQVSVDAKQRQVFLQVPSFLIGYPMFDVATAAVYLKRQLELSGFKVVALSEDTFNVSWYRKTKPREPEPIRPYVYDPTPPVDDQQHFPSLVNLRKAAKRYA